MNEQRQQREFGADFIERAKTQRLEALSKKKAGLGKSRPRLGASRSTPSFAAAAPPGGFATRKASANIDTTTVRPGRSSVMSGKFLGLDAAAAPGRRRRGATAHGASGGRSPAGSTTGAKPRLSQTMGTTGRGAPKQAWGGGSASPGSDGGFGVTFAQERKGGD